jgi:peptidoglycan-N-acetylglucosamine deacetylase
LARWEVVANFLEKAVASGEVWFASMEEIAAHIQSVTASGAYKPRRVDMPAYKAPVYDGAVRKYP